MYKINLYSFRFLFLLIICLSVFVRADKISTYTSEIDDHVVAVSILRAKEPIDVSSIRYSIYDTSKSTFNSFPKRTLRKIDASHRLEKFLNTAGGVAVYFAVPNQTTYAPAQFFFTKFLINKNQNLTTVLFWGRLPSLVFSLVGIFLFYFFIRKFFTKEIVSPAFIYAFLVLALSYEFVIYSKQMESYALGIPAFIGYSWVLLNIFTRNKILSAKQMILFGFLSGLFVWMQYQMLFFVVAGYAAIGIYQVRSKRINKKIITNTILSGIAFLIVFLPVYVLFLSKHTDHVSAHLSGGSKTNFFFPALTYTNVWDYIWKPVYFFFNNGLEVYNYMTLFLQPKSPGAILFLLINIILFVFGIYKITKDTNPTRRFFHLFIFLSFVIWILLVLKGGITFSPNRHSLILLPTFCIIIYSGFEWILQTISKPANKNLGYLLPLTALVLFCFNYPSFISERKEPYLYTVTGDFFKKNAPDCIVTKDDILFLMPEIYNKIDVFFKSDDKSLERWISKKKNDTSYKRIALIGFEPTDTAILHTLLNKKDSEHIMQHENSFHRIDSLKIDSKTDEIHESFTRWVKLRINIYQKTKR